MIWALKVAGDARFELAIEGSLDTRVQAGRNRPLCQSPGDGGAESRNRICDARAFNATLYRLSYLGMMGGAPRGSRIPGFLLDREALWPLSYRGKENWWRWAGTIRRPTACKAVALPAELHPRGNWRSMSVTIRPTAFAVPT